MPKRADAHLYGADHPHRVLEQPDRGRGAAIARVGQLNQLPAQLGALGLALDARHRLEILVLHVHSPTTVPTFSGHEPHATRTWEHEFLTRHVATPHDRVKLLHRLGVPADDVLAVAHESATDLVVLAWSQSLGPGRAHVVSETLAHASTPVLLVPVTSSRRHRSRRRQ